jgi:hypothetical protein
MAAAGYQGSLIEFKLIKGQVEKLRETIDQDPSRTFLALCLTQYLGIDQYTAEDCIIDGSDDCGIDAIYFNVEDVDNPIVYLFQSKFYRVEGKYSRALEGSAIDKMLQTTDMLFFQPKRERSYTSVVLDEKLKQYESFQNVTPKFRLVFCSNSYPAAPKAQEKLQHWIEDRYYGEDIFEPVYLHLREIAKLIAPDQRKKINDKLRLSGTWFSYESGTARTVVGKVSVEELARLYGEHGEFLFDKNVREYLKDSNLVNQRINETLTHDKSHEFFYLNNGVTIVCNKLSYAPMNSDPVISMEGLQIVNGSQTTHTVHAAFKNDTIKNKEHVFALVKVIQTEDTELLNNITEATNSQTAVTSRDIRSNDPTQRIVEEHLRALGYYYEARANKYLNSKEVRPDQRVDAATGAQVWLAFHLQKPYLASTKKSQLFRDPLYKEVFPDDLDVRAYLDAYLLFKYIHKLGKARKEDYPFVNYAKFHIMALLKQLDITDTKSFEQNSRGYADIIESIKILLAREQRKKNFTGYGAFFNQPTLLDRISKEYEFLKSPDS